ncbi:hypothetical protein HYU23_02610 [Candidatus Woesearchaeota archaeon]|nr:hypothetical protein [Candidatus Woesearchaeota archaeon]
MLNKRGIGHEIDWVIGMGLFLTSVIFIFVIFRPGVTKIHDPKTLLDIIQDGFNNDTYWTITNVPVFLHPANSTYKTGNDIAIVDLSNKKINVSCKGKNPCRTDNYNTLQNLIKGKDKFNIKVYYVKRDERDDLPKPDFKVDPNIKTDPKLVCKLENDKKHICKDRDPELIEQALNIYKDPAFDRPGEIIYNLTNTAIIMPALLEESITDQPIKTKYLVSASNKPINFNLKNITSQFTYRFTACAKVGENDWPYSEGVAASCNVIYELGVEDVAEGIDLASFFSLNITKIHGNDCIQGYDCIKEKWKFPRSKEFNIKIESLPIGIKQSNISVIFPIGVSPPENVNTFVRQFNSFVLTEKSTRIPVMIRITTW